jgi:hypothetical protein
VKRRDLPIECGFEARDGVLRAAGFQEKHAVLRGEERHAVRVRLSVLIAAEGELAAGRAVARANVLAAESA